MYELIHTLHSYEARKADDDLTSIESFLRRYPTSPWHISLLTNLGLLDYHYGYFTKALSSWERAWVLGRYMSDPKVKALVDRAVGELARMHARLGHSQELSLLLKDVESRHVTGPATEAITGAKEGLWMMRNQPGVAFLCGPMALKDLLRSLRVPQDHFTFLDKYRSGRSGVSLAQVS